MSIIDIVQEKYNSLEIATAKYYESENFTSVSEIINLTYALVGVLETGDSEKILSIPKNSETQIQYNNK